MEPLDYWRLCDELSVIDAALLIVGEDPSQNRYIDDWEPHKRPSGYEAAIAALQNSINSGSLVARIVHGGEYVEWFNQGGEEQAEWVRSSTPNWNKTTIKVENLKNWLKSRGFKTGFFFPDRLDAPDYLDENHSCYAPKLAAAINAWEAITADEKLLDGKTPKQAIEKWLRENASYYGLSDDDGNPNKDGIEQISKVANWRPEGGAAKTKGNPPTPKKPNKKANF